MEADGHGDSLATPEYAPLERRPVSTRELSHFLLMLLKCIVRNASKDSADSA